MRLVVTGCHGQLAHSLLERGAGRSELETIALGRPRLDLERPETVEQALRAAAPDIVVNAAAYTAVDDAESEPDRAMLVNTEGAGAVARAAAGIGARLIQISTDYVFDGASPIPYDENAATGPINAYGRSKLAGEEAVRRAAPDHLILRTSWVYSPWGRNFVTAMVRLAESRDEVGVVSDQYGNPSSALDLADAILAIARRWNAGDRIGIGQIYHVAGGGSIASWFDLASHVFAECARLGLAAATVRPILTADWPTAAMRPHNSALDCSRFRRDFGHALPDWRESVSEVVARLAGERG